MIRDAAGVINDARKAQQRSVAWLARETGISYKRLLRELSSRRDEIPFFHVILCARVLHLDLTEIIREVAA